MKNNFSYKKSTYLQWKFGFVVLFLFLLLALVNSDTYQKNVGLFIFACLMAYGSFLYTKFLQDPSEISITENGLVLIFRKIPARAFKYEEIEYIKKSNNPFFDYVKGRLEIKIRNSEEKYRISGNIEDFDRLIEILRNRGFELKE